MLNQLKFNTNPQLTLKDKIITIVCAFMHDSCRKGEGVDFWDNDSAILATKVLKIFGLDSEEDKKYLMEVMKYVGDKDASVEHGDFKNKKKGNWEITKEDLKQTNQEAVKHNEQKKETKQTTQSNNTFKNKAKIIATLVDLGDTEEVFRVRYNFDIDFFLSKLNKIGISIEGYFNKDLDQLSVSEVAFLCAIPNSPSYYDPRSNYDHTIERRDKILNDMHELGYINELELQMALEEDIELVPVEKVSHDYVETYTNFCATEALMEAAGFTFKYKFSTISSVIIAIFSPFTTY